MNVEDLIVVLICGLIVGFPLGYFLFGPIVSPPFQRPRIDQFNVYSTSYSGVSGIAPNYINMTIQNTGSSAWTLTNTAQVNNFTGLTVTDLSVKNGRAYNCTSGKSINILIAMNPGWISGKEYYINLLLTDGVEITYGCSAP
ncbi:MAG TPA: hypothetical protein VK487_05185 [Candidatus Bathyarchaeia archaeon]|nr:hypothetical protein [Candidatus Bathyarchaeia archaeon]